MLLSILFQSPILFLTIAIAILLALSIHESAHAWVANRLGDDTAAMLGRISLNPLVHLDLIGTAFLLIIGFGWGKPVPFNPNKLKSPTRDAILIALSGPTSNLILASLIVFIFHTTQSITSDQLKTLLLTIGYFNLLFMLFNLLPIPPLDGSRILSLFIPEHIFARIERYGFILLLILIFVGFGSTSLFDVLITHPLSSLFYFFYHQPFPF